MNLDPFSLLWCGAVLIAIGVFIGAALVGASWGTHNIRMAHAASQREREQQASRKAAEIELIRAATAKLKLED